MKNNKKEKHNLDTCTGEPCSCRSTKTPDWMVEFEKEFPKSKQFQHYTQSLDRDRFKSFISKILTAQREELVEEILEKLLHKNKDYYCTAEQLGYHDKNCNGCEISREQIETLLKSLKD